MYSSFTSKSSSIGLGAYSGSNESLFGAKGPAGFLAKFTFVMGILLIANTIGLGYLYNKASKDSLAEKIKVENNNTTIPVLLLCLLPQTQILSLQVHHNFQAMLTQVNN